MCVCVMDDEDSTMINDEDSNESLGRVEGVVGAAARGGEGAEWRWWWLGHGIIPFFVYLLYDIIGPVLDVSGRVWHS